MTELHYTARNPKCAIVVSAWERRIVFVCVSLTVNAWNLIMRALKLEHQAQSSLRFYDLEVIKIQSMAEWQSTQKFQPENLVNKLIYSQTLLFKKWHPASALSRELKERRTLMTVHHVTRIPTKRLWFPQSWMPITNSSRYWHETIKDRKRRTSKNNGETKESNSCTCEPTKGWSQNNNQLNSFLPACSFKWY